MDALFDAEHPLIHFRDDALTFVVGELRPLFLGGEALHDLAADRHHVDANAIRIVGVGGRVRRWAASKSAVVAWSAPAAIGPAAAARAAAARAVATTAVATAVGAAVEARAVESAAIAAASGESTVVGRTAARGIEAPRPPLVDAAAEVVTAVPSARPTEGCAGVAGG